MNDTQTKLLTILNSYGDIVELDWNFDVDNIITELSNNDNWIKGPSVSAPLGLPLTGSNNLDLRTKDHLEGQFNKKVPPTKKEIKGVLEGTIKKPTGIFS